MVSTEMVRLDLPALKTSLPGPRAQELIERDNQVLSPSYTRGYPLVVSRGDGAILEDVDGNRFLDFNAGIAVTATGHNHPRVTAAVQAQAAKFLHYSGTDFYYENMVQLAEKLAAIAPGGVPRRIYFGNSGTEAIEAAMKLARYHSGRDKFIAFFGSFHGRTMGSLSLTASKVIQRKHFGSLVPGVSHTTYPNPYRRPAGMTADDFAVACVRDIEEVLFRHTVPAEEVAAIFVEPVQGEGGYVVPPPVFFERLQELAQKHGILLIADEIQCGMGRTGKMWASDHFGLIPDILTSAKGIASGMPLSAMIARREVMDWKPGAHASTYGGNPVAIAASLATIELLESELIENSRRMGEVLMGKIRDWPQRFRSVGDVRGLGLMIGIEFVRNQETKERAPEIRDLIVDLAFERGLLTLGAGPNSIRLCPPLVINRDQVDFAVSTLEQCIQKAEAQR